ncbi:hypothetical protein C4559_01745 [Candidatus Microgenomates bacterium]|nr:MAG: hypothetical protein C4559_01745 [Candidatus Microgenomates bacterium]
MFNETQYFITHSDEKLLAAKRSHLFVLFAPLVGTIFFACISIFSIFIFQKLFPLIVSPTLLVGVIFVFSLCMLSLTIKLFVDWYFHLYVVTSRKILEVCYKPFFSKDIRVIPLDQMRCVEVNVTTQGFIKTLLDIGDVSIKLDLLTHQDIFTMTNIISPQKTGIDITEALNHLIVSRVDNESNTIPLAVPYDNTAAEEQFYPAGKTLQSPQTYNTPSQNIVYMMMSERLLRKGG